MVLGSWRNRPKLPLNITWTDEPIKLLGIYISNNSHETVMANFHSKVETLLRQLLSGKLGIYLYVGKFLLLKHWLYLNFSIWHH